MQHDRAFTLDADTLREDLAIMERQIRFTPNDNDLLRRYLTYARKVREIEYREKGYVTARNQPPRKAGVEHRLRGQVLEDASCC